MGMGGGDCPDDVGEHEIRGFKRDADHSTAAQRHRS
jgi:hypothetical protein